MRNGLVLTLALAALGLGALASLAQDPGPTPAQPDADAVLTARYAALSKDADALAADYRKAIEAKIDALARAKPTTLGRLREAGIFKADALLAGISPDSLLALPYLKRALEHTEEQALDTEREYIKVAIEKNEASAILLLKKIAAAQHIFREEDRDGNGVLDYAETLYDLTAAGLRIQGVKRGQSEIAVDGYKIRIQHADTLHWAADAIPVEPRKTGDRWFYVDESTIVRAKQGAAADMSSEPVR